MSTKAKIITATMGLICLAITLVFPSNSTILSIVPVIVTFSAWIFISNNKNIRPVEGIFMGLSLIAIAACFLFGMAYDYDGEHVSLILKNGAVFLNNVDYVPIAIALFLSALSLAMGDIVCSHRVNVKNENVTVRYTYNELVNQSIVVIK